MQSPCQEPAESPRRRCGPTDTPSTTEAVGKQPGGTGRARALHWQGAPQGLASLETSAPGCRTPPHTPQSLQHRCCTLVTQFSLAQWVDAQAPSLRRGASRCAGSGMGIPALLCRELPIWTRLTQGCPPAPRWGTGPAGLRGSGDLSQCQPQPAVPAAGAAPVQPDRASPAQKTSGFACVRGSIRLKAGAPGGKAEGYCLVGGFLPANSTLRCKLKRAVRRTR